MKLFCDCKTDEEKSNFFLSGRAVETGVIAPAISNEIAMAYHRCAQLKKENDALRAELDALKAWKAEVEAQKPVGYWDPCDDMYFLPGFLLPHSEAKMEPRYARPLPGAKGE